MYLVSIFYLFIYLAQQGMDLLAGVEAVISHMVVKEFKIPCAHAPALSPLPLSSSLCPRSAAEEVIRFLISSYQQKFNRSFTFVSNYKTL